MPSSAGVSYDGGPQTWSLPRSTYLSGPRAQGPQTYLPVVLSSSQGIVPTHGWNTYPGSMSPVSSTGIVGEFPFPTSVSSHQLPERPDQPECRYFMNTGSCKYGTECKYNHPREKIAQLASSSLGPLGLPLRPGQAVCSYYSLYGLCKYGPTCKFDHPLMGYPYNYNLNLPTLSILDPSLLPNYQRNMPAVQLSDTSPSKSSKFPDWNHKPETADKKNPIPEDSPELPGSPSDSIPAPPDTPHGQSD
ncbi:hypothetical protein LguiB_002593 [Lonicera macranthoides]